MGEETLDWAVEAVPTYTEALKSRHEQGGSIALRVHQWEAGVLDGELRGLLKGGLMRALPPSMLPLKPEVDALLRFMEFVGSVASGLPTPGMRISGLKHSPSLSWRRRVAWGMLVVLFPWLTIQLRIRLTREGRLNALRWLDSVEGLVSLAKVLNMLAFLRGGRFPSLEDRLSGMTLEYNGNSGTNTNGLGMNAINYAFLGRRLLFNTFTGTSDAFSRLADWYTTRQWVVRHIRTWKGWHRRFILQQVEEGGGGGLERDEAAAENVILSSCVECGANPPCMPHLATCGHVFCYLCCAAHYDGDRSYLCPECGVQLDSLVWVHQQSS